MQCWTLQTQFRSNWRWETHNAPSRQSHLFGVLARTLGLIICKIHLVIIWSNKHCTFLTQCSPQLGGTWLAHEIHKTHENTQNTQYHRVHITWAAHGWPHLAADPAPVKPQLFRPTHSHFSMMIQIQVQIHSWNTWSEMTKKCFILFLVACNSPDFFSPTKLILTTHGEILLDIVKCLFSLCWIKESSEEIRNRAEPLVLSCSDQGGWPCLLSDPN